MILLSQIAAVIFILICVSSSTVSIDITFYGSGGVWNRTCELSVSCGGSFYQSYVERRADENGLWVVRSNFLVCDTLRWKWTWEVSGVIQFEQRQEGLRLIPTRILKETHAVVFTQIHGGTHQDEVIYGPPDLITTMFTLDGSTVPDQTSLYTVCGKYAGSSIPDLVNAKSFCLPGETIVNGTVELTAYLLSVDYFWNWKKLESDNVTGRLEPVDDRVIRSVKENSDERIVMIFMWGQSSLASARTTTTRHSSEYDRTGTLVTTRLQEKTTDKLLLYTMPIVATSTSSTQENQSISSLAKVLETRSTTSTQITNKDNVGKEMRGSLTALNVGMATLAGASTITLVLIVILYQRLKFKYRALKEASDSDASALVLRERSADEASPSSPGSRRELIAHSGYVDPVELHCQGNTDTPTKEEMVASGQYAEIPPRGELEESNEYYNLHSWRQGLVVNGQDVPISSSANQGLYTTVTSFGVRQDTAPDSQSPRSDYINLNNLNQQYDSESSKSFSDI